MEPITIIRHPDLKTYYKINLMIMYGRMLWVGPAGIALVGALSFYEYRKFVWTDYIYITEWMFLIYAVILPIFLWFASKKAAKGAPTLAETVTYRINNDYIEGTTASSVNKNPWKYITKVIEKKDHIIMYTNARVFYFFPKTGFESTADIEKFKEMVKANNIRAYFK